MCQTTSVYLSTRSVSSICAYALRFPQSDRVIESVRAFSQDYLYRMFSLPDSARCQCSINIANRQILWCLRMRPREPLWFQKNCAFFFQPAWTKIQLRSRKAMNYRISHCDSIAFVMRPIQQAALRGYCDTDIHLSVYEMSTFPWAIAPTMKTGVAFSSSRVAAKSFSLTASPSLENPILMLSAGRCFVTGPFTTYTRGRMSNLYVQFPLICLSFWRIIQSRKSLVADQVTVLQISGIVLWIMANCICHNNSLAWKPIWLYDNKAEEALHQYTGLKQYAKSNSLCRIQQYLQRDRKTSGLWIP